MQSLFSKVALLSILLALSVNSQGLPFYLDPMGKLGSLPYDKEVLYLESTGTQYIALSYNIGPNIRFEFNAEWTGVSVGYAIGRRWGNNSGTWECFIDASGGYFANSNIGTNHILSLNTNYTYEFDLTSGALSLKQNGNIIKSSTGIYPERSGIYIWGILGLPNGTGVDTFAKAKVYYYKLWKNGTIKLDLIPVRVGTTGYMYDKVSGSLFGNNGIGAFTLGADKP